MYNFSLNTCLFSILLSCSIISACSSSEPDKQQPGLADLVLPGWVSVSFGLDSEYLQENRGALDESYDEFVGGLIDDGLVIEDSRWLKLTYGNENLIWTLNAALGSHKISALESSREEFTNSGYRFTQGTLGNAGVKWRYSGYSLQTPDQESPGFKSYVFVCDGNKGVSIFYWGDSGIAAPQENESILNLMELLSGNC